MAKLIRAEHSKTWGQRNETTGKTRHILSCYFSEDDEYNFMGATQIFHANIDCTKATNDEAEKLADKFINDEAFHATKIQCWTFTVDELTKDTNYHCESVDIIGAGISDVRLRYIASPLSREKAKTLEQTRVLRMLANKKWKEHTAE